MTALPDTAVTALAAPEERGRTEIADRVVQRIAARAVAEVDLAAGTTRRIFGVPLGRDASRADPVVNVQVDGALAILRLGISVTYPAPVRQVTRQVREHVSSQVGRLTGLQVRQVDIEVTSLTPPSERGRRVR